MKRVIILGSTGSVGKDTLKVIAAAGDRFRVVGLAVYGNNRGELQRQVSQFSPQLVAVYDREKQKGLQDDCPSCPIVAGAEGLELVADLDADLLVAAMAGSMGVRAVLRALASGKDVLIANKELLVCAGSLIMEQAKRYNRLVLPIDSELSAIFQCLQGEKLLAVNRVILTASGGPFLRKSAQELLSVSLEESLLHPTWKGMGSHVTVNCSTLMNKAYEFFEAMHFFGLPINNVSAVIHPESTIHGFVEFSDGSLKAQIATPSMLLPIQYALDYPDRAPSLLLPLNLTNPTLWSFEPVDEVRFPCLPLAREVARTGGTLPALLVGANEALVDLFLRGAIAWSDIARYLQEILEKEAPSPECSLEAIEAAEARGRSLVVAATEKAARR